MSKKFTLQEIMTITEASERYGISHDKLKVKFKPSKTEQEKIDAWVAQGLVKQSGRTWLLTKQFIEENFPVSVEG